jgi:hypothetical protein
MNRLAPLLAGLLIVYVTDFPCPAASLSNPQVDRYNVHVGTQTFAGLYQFTTNSLLVETAQAIRALGSDVIKGYLGKEIPLQWRTLLPSNVTNLVTLVRDQPSGRAVLDMPFNHFVLWAYPFTGGWPFDGYSASERASDYRELYDLTRYFLTNYNNSGKTFYLGHWEGDWYLLPGYNAATNPSPVAIQGMIDWLNNRQKAVDDAKRDTAFSNVNVFHYAEVNRVRDAMSNNTNIDQRAINDVVPYVTNLDCLSWSSYDGMDLPAPDLNATLDYMRSMLPTNKAATFPGQRLWIGEYGWGGYSTDAQEPLARAYIQRLLSWGPRFILFWEMYNNETNRNFCLINSNNVKVASWHLHQRFINRARLLTARFLESHGRLPSDAEFGALTTPMLSQPLPASTPLALTNLAAKLITNTAARVSGILAQGLYGDDQARVRVCWGLTDAGTNAGAWDSSQNAGLNTNFNPASFTVTLSNLAPDRIYFYRFYATNANSEGWAAGSGRFSTAFVEPKAFGSRLKITFSGYDRGEPLANFPVLVSLSTNLAGFSYREFAAATGADLRFADADGVTSLFHEIDEWNTAGTSFVWVRIPWLASTNDCVWAYWGNPSAARPPTWSTNGSVWSENFALVWHLKESGFPYADGTLHHPALSGNPPTGIAVGAVGRAALFDGASDFLNTGSLDLGDHVTVSAWVKPDPAADDIRTVWASQKGGYGSAGFALYINSYTTSDQKLVLETGNGTAGNTAATATNAVPPGQWHHVAAAIDRTAGTARLFVDGVNRTVSSAVRTDFATQSNVALGYMSNGVFYFKGAVDEARLENATRSSNWVWASWMTVAANTNFATYSAVERDRPRLSISSDASAPLVSWPASGVGFSVFTTSNLAPPVVWSPATHSPVLVSGSWEFPVTVGPGARFYRLQD